MFIYKGSKKSVANWVIGNEIPQVLYRNPTGIPQQSHSNTHTKNLFNIPTREHEYSNIEKLSSPFFPPRHYHLLLFIFFTAKSPSLNPTVAISLSILILPL